jgi:mediator of replication checkpoint protein 1
MMNQGRNSDQSLEKYHLDAVEGKFRSKRRNRGLDSDEDDEDDDRVQGQLRKKRTLGENMESLGLCAYLPSICGSC